uniref:Neprilysin n=1 Tax=Hadrurus spadix TaxID=141984 RepID=A0A1W7RA43_9SCOR
MMEHMNVKLNGEAPPVKTKCAAWRKKTKLEKYLIVICITIFIAFLVMIGVVLYLEHVYTRPKVPICTSAVCRAQAAKVMSYMDFNVDPCEDFYNFSCGSFSKVKTSNYHNRYVSFTIAEDNVLRITKEVLEATENEEPDFAKKVRLYYKACLEQDSDTSIIIEQFQNKTGLYHWPILEYDDYEEDQILEEALSIIDINDGTNAFYRLRSGHNYTVFQLRLYPGDVFPTEDILLNDTDESSMNSRRKYRNLLIYTFFKAGTVLEVIESEVDQILDFETLFANITKNLEEENSTEITLKELADECKEIKWMQIVKNIFEYFGHSDDYHDEIPVEISNKKYIEDLCQLLQRTKKRTIYNYLVWQFMALQLRKFDNYFEKSYREMMDSDGSQLSSKSESCIRQMFRNSLNHGLNYLVINHLQPDKSIEEVKEWVKEIKQEMHHMFSIESWLDEKSRKIARERLANISGAIGYSKPSLDIDFIEKVFSQINISNNHIDNYLFEERRGKRQRMFNDTFNIHSELDIIEPLDVSAYFMGEKFVLTLGAMQLPFYAYKSPKYLNYAVLGFVIAHELSHAYDSLDLDNDKDNCTEPWPEEILEIFREKKQCYVDQYSKYPVYNNGTMVDGNFTYRDNIADNSGIVQVFKAYERNAIAEREEPRLPGFADYTNRQMFFLSYAQIWCETVEDPNKAFKYDSHSPGRYRVIGPLQNFPRFSEVYNCPVGSPMNPKDKCRMWG